MYVFVFKGFIYLFFYGLYSQKIKTLKNVKIKKKTRKTKSLMEEEIPLGTK